MVGKKYEIVWTKTALKHLAEAFGHINKDSPKNATKVVQDIVSAVYKAVNNPEIYNSDKFKADNDGSYRAFEKHRYRITYRYKKNIIRVLRIRHTSMKPLKH